MFLIAHRGLLNGPDPTLENHPDQIQKALDFGFHAEVDVRYIDGAWWLGHDAPTHLTTWDFISKRNLWLHAKNLDALEQLQDTVLNYFAHDKDPWIITSHGYIWTYPGIELGSKSICVMPEWKLDLDASAFKIAAGICSDWPEHYK